VRIPHSINHRITAYFFFFEKLYTFSYPLVYIICILPNSICRWLFFSSSKTVPYQASLFASTLFSLSGMFNAILFFYTRPALVVAVSPSDTPLPHLASTDSRIQSHHHFGDEIELTRFGSQIPARGSPVASDYVAPGLEEYTNYFPPYHSYHSRMLPEGGSSHHWPSGSATRVPSAVSRKRSHGDFRSMASPPGT
jgi:hypothetical protein